MINVNKGEIELEGNVIDICTELIIAFDFAKKSFIDDGIPESEINMLMSATIKTVMQTVLEPEDAEKISELSDAAAFGKMLAKAFMTSK